MRGIVLAVSLAVVVPVAVLGQGGKPDFSGRWVLDASKSDEAPAAGRAARAGGAGRAGGGMAAGSAGPVLIAQTDTEITIGAATYKLDGSRMAQGPRGIAEGKAFWEGSTLVVETSRSLRGMTMSTKEVRSLSADGTEMTVESTINGPNGGEVKTKQVYKKN